MGYVRPLLVCLLSALAFDCGAPPNAVIVNDFGDAGPGDCNSTCTLRDAIKVALMSNPIKTVLFSPVPGWPQTITLIDGQLSITNASADTFQIVGPGAAKLAISANNNSRVFDVVSGISYIDSLTVRDGNVVGAPGANGFPETGEDGDAPTVFVTGGGCILVEAAATLTLDHADVRNCSATGGRGGNGGSGVPIFGIGGTGGNGSGAGEGAGGGIFVAGNMTLVHSSVVLSSAIGGAGGSGGEGGGGFVSGTGGTGGQGGPAAGGAVYIASDAVALLQNSTLAASNATGGQGGAGGNSFSGTGGTGNSGGLAYGGLLHGQGPASDIEMAFATLASGSTIPGQGGIGGSGSPGGAPGQPGPVQGSDINMAGTIVVASSIVVGPAAYPPLCHETLADTFAVAPGSANLDQDSSCPGFTQHATFDALFAAQDVATTPWLGYVPRYHSVIIGAAANCKQVDGLTNVTDDEHATPRPQGSACDLGAIEADYIFVDTFG